jgi:hypothetical protein
MRRYDEGFADLREAAISDPELQPNLIDLAWGLSRGDLKLTEQILQINKPGMRLSYARFLARKGFGQEALGQLRTAGSVPELLRKEIVSNLIGKKSFRPAFDIWLDDNPSPEPPAIFDGGFEASLRLEEIGFGWRVARGEAGMVLAVDPTEKQSGLRSLRIHFNGNGNPGTSVVSQLVVVKPLKRYRLNFASRSQEIVSGGLPLLIITGATTDQILGKGELVREGSQGWDVHSLEFQTGVDEEAIIITLKRQNCAAVPCPIFGILWLDSFSIEELNGMKN